ncbi:hypothetical protein AX13_06745 [Comamonas aquatica DA1877]|uniref:EF-hand domain-containing protein n=1 Tax=Comamonas aquatica DA1877 TaxID=1457173 RepID=A0A014P5P2_9BURK|nr:EF-hand domain-containing protein [Comamonas aquatica]EXU81490.1 hypothetical protein AX13_06745 [Comamonas aquatica DA1877]
MPTSRRQLHAFDVRSVLLFASLTLGGTAAVMAQNQGTPPAKTASTTATTTPTATLAITPTAVFKRADRNRDGQLSREEAEHLPSVAAQFDQWDRDGNGQLSLQEFMQHTQPAR